MVAVGKKVVMARHILHVRNLEMVNASAQLDLKVMVSKHVKISMNARRKLLVSALSVAVKIPGEVMIAPAVETFYTSKNMILA